MVRNEEELIALYDKIYRNIKGYGKLSRRHHVCIDWMLKNTPPPASVLDAGCGQGDFLQRLLDEGYRATGTEVANCLFEPSGSLASKPALQLSYGELGLLPNNAYDIVMSCDVLEHLLNEDAVKRAVKDLIRLSRRHVLMTVGWNKAEYCERRMREHRILQAIPGENLHIVVKDIEWWDELFSKDMNCLFTHRDHVSYFWFGEKREAD